MDSYRKEKPRRKVSSRPGTGKGPDRRTDHKTRNSQSVSGRRPLKPGAADRTLPGKPSGSNAEETGTRIQAGVCPAYRKCGGCDYQGVAYEEQLRRKNREMQKLLGGVVDIVHPIIGMKDPKHYRCKVNAVFGLDRKGHPVSGNYEKNSHRIVPVESCMIEDEKADAIIRTIRSLLHSFRIRTYDEDSRFGFLRHVQVRKGYATGEYMVTLVCTDPVFPSKNNFVKALRKDHPEISTVILNINDKSTSMVLGELNLTLYGRGFIEDELGGCRFRISPGSFYQVNPPQTQILYDTAIRAAHLAGQETVMDAYCGTGTIGIIASRHAGNVYGVELNRDAVRDAIWNARRNEIQNIRFVSKDAGDYMDELSQSPEEVLPDVVILDPPRTGTTQKFIDAAARMAPERIVYVSCGPDTLARDLKLFRKKGYKALEAQPVDLFPFTEHCEVVVSMCRQS